MTSSARRCSDLVQLSQVVDVALEVGLAGALRGGADDHAALALVDVLEQLALALALGVGEAPAGAHAAPERHVDEVAARDRELHREPRALRLQRVLDHLNEDLLARLQQLVDPPPLAATAARALLAAGEDDLVDVQESVALEADVDERGLHAGEDVVDDALVDVADDRPLVATLDVELGDLPVAVALGLRLAPTAAAASAARALASSIATRVSPASTETSIRFFKCSPQRVDGNPLNGADPPCSWR